MASTIKVTNINTPDGTGNITVDRPLSGSGASLTALNATNLASGTVPTARLGSGTASSSTFLRGDSTYATVSAGADTALSNLTTAGQNAVAQVWVSYNQTTPAVIDSFNVSSVTDTSAGIFTVNFDDDLPNATYVAFAKDTGSAKIHHQHTNSKAVGSVEARTYNQPTTLTDLTDTNVIVFGD